MQRRATLGQTPCSDRRGQHIYGQGAAVRFCVGQVIRAEARDIGSDPLLPVLAQEGQTPCRTVKPNGHQGGGTWRYWGAESGWAGVCPDVPPSFASHSHSTETQGKMLSVCQYEAFYNNYKPEKSFVGVGVM